MTRGTVMTRIAFMSDVLRENGFDDEEIDAWSRENRGDHTFQVCLMAGGQCRCLWFTASDLQPLREEDAHESKLMAARWESELQQRIYAGQPE